MLDQYIGHWPLIQKRGHVLVYVNAGVILRMSLNEWSRSTSTLQPYVSQHRMRFPLI